MNRFEKLKRGLQRSCASGTMSAWHEPTKLMCKLCLLC